VIEAAQGFRFRRYSVLSALLRLQPDGFKHISQGGDEVLKPGSKIVIASAKVLVVMRMDCQCLIVPPKVFGIVLLQREEAA